MHWRLLLKAQNVAHRGRYQGIILGNAIQIKTHSMNDIDPIGLGEKLTKIGRIIIRYGLVIVVGWIGALKFTEYEAKGIEGLLVNSPFIVWAYHLVGLRALSSLIGIVEILVAILLALRYLAPAISTLGGIGAILMFLTTLSFLFSTPVAFQAEGFPFLSGAVGQFLIKDLVLLGAAVWMTGDSLRASVSARGQAFARGASSILF
jgi:uncharacterized membrane protein YkgB